MADIKAQILVYLAAMWRRRWYAAGAAWLVCTIGWVYVALLPDVFEAKTRIYVDTDSLLRPLMRGLAIDTNTLNEVDLMQRTLLSQPNLVRVSRVTDQDLAAKTSLEQEALVSELGRRIRIVDNGRNLFTISYQGNDRNVGKRVVEELVNILVETNLGVSRKEMTSARSFVDDQVREYERQLNEAEQRVAQFKAENVGLVGGSGSSNSSSLESARAEYQRTQGELEETRQRSAELERQLADVPQFIEVTNSEPLGPTLGGPAPADGPSFVGNPALQIADLEQRLSALRLRYTSKHPDVIDTVRLLQIAKANLKKEQKRIQEGGDDGRTVTSTISNPVYERLQLQLIDERARVATLTNRLERNEAELRKWEGLAKSIPGVSAELSRLTRDYEVIRRNYTELVSRREAAKIGAEMESQTKNTQFRLIDPPEVAGKPIGPNRRLFLSLVFFFGIAAGGAFAFFLSQIDDSISHVDQMRKTLKLPVLGSVSAMRSAIDQRVNRLASVAYAATFAALVAAYAGLMTVEIFLRRGA